MTAASQEDKPYKSMLVWNFSILIFAVFARFPFIINEFIFVIRMRKRDTSQDNLIEELRQRIERRNTEAGDRPPLSLSIGTAFYNPLSPCSVEELLLQADQSMYEQKRIKKSCLKPSPPSPSPLP